MGKSHENLIVFGVVIHGLGGIIVSGYFLVSGIVVRRDPPRRGFILGAVLVYWVMTAFVDPVLNLPRNETFHGYPQEVLGPAWGFVAASVFVNQ
ncbi:MAG: hypothetical protein M0Z41_02500 [Peptococcaceae bacterium]|jgi:amino acid permease|nr:hypothetical protein [Peptococcaceae bacterium]